MPRRPSAPSSIPPCPICVASRFMYCSPYCIFRPSRYSPIWHHPDGSPRAVADIHNQIQEYVAWRLFGALNRIRDDPRAAAAMAAMVDPAIPARNYTRLAEDSSLFIMLSLSFLGDTATTRRLHDIYREMLRQRILENYARAHAHPGRQPGNDPNFRRWASRLLDTVNAVYGQTRPGGDQAAPRQSVPEANLGGAVMNVTDPGAAATTAAAAAAVGSVILVERVAPNDPAVFAESADPDMPNFRADEIMNTQSDSVASPVGSQGQEAAAAASPQSGGSVGDQSWIQ